MLVNEVPLLPKEKHQKHILIYQGIGDLPCLPIISVRLLVS